MCFKNLIFSRILRNYSKQNTKKFIISGTFSAKIVDVYDGDTCQIVIFHNFAFQRFSLRIEGIDAPEIKDKNALIKEKAIDVRNIVRNLILNKTLTVTITGFEKYGRLLGDITLPNNQLLSKHLLGLGLVQEYDGGKKPTHLIY